MRPVDAGADDGLQQVAAVVEGALVAADVTRPLSSLVIFQYNPDTVRRTISARTAREGGDPSEALRLAGPPDESISMQIESTRPTSLRPVRPTKPR